MLNTKLVDRTLWYDGDSSYDPRAVISALSDGHTEVKYVTSLTPDIIQYNSFASSADALVVKTECDDLRIEWNIYKEYRDWETDRKSTRLNSSHSAKSRMPSSA